MIALSDLIEKVVTVSKSLVGRTFAINGERMTLDIVFSGSLRYIHSERILVDLGKLA